MKLPFVLPFDIPATFKIFATLSTARAWGTSQQDPPLAERPYFELDALRRYKGLHYRAINAHLRQDKQALKDEKRKRAGYFRDLLETDIELLDESLADAAIDKPIVVWRVIDKPEVITFILNHVGEAFVDNGFISTTLNPFYAWDLVKRAKHKAMLTVLLPATSPGLFLENIDLQQAEGREFELLLPRRSVFLVCEAGLDQEGVMHGLLELQISSSASSIKRV